MLHVGRAVARQRVALMPLPWMLPMKKRAAILLGELIGVVDAQPRSRRPPGGAAVVIDGSQCVCGGYGPALAVVVAALRQVPEVVDHAAGDEPVALAVVVQAPGVARPLGEELELSRLGMAAEDRAGEVVTSCRRAGRWASLKTPFKP